VLDLDLTERPRRTLADRRDGRNSRRRSLRTSVGHCIGLDPKLRFRVAAPAPVRRSPDGRVWPVQSEDRTVVRAGMHINAFPVAIAGRSRLHRDAIL
jgi:hypothetical protein